MKVKLQLKMKLTYISFVSAEKLSFADTTEGVF